MYRFYVKLDDEQFGPFSAAQIVNQYLDDLENYDDIDVMEESIGVWHKATDYPWAELIQKETGASINSSGEVKAGGSGGTYTPSSNRDGDMDNDNSTRVEPESNFWLCIISFLFPLVGWILYFVYNRDTRGQSYAKWAWIGFLVNVIILTIERAS